MNSDFYSSERITLRPKTNTEWSTGLSFLKVNGVRPQIRFEYEDGVIVYNCMAEYNGAFGKILRDLLHTAKHSKHRTIATRWYPFVDAKTRLSTGRHYISMAAEPINSKDIILIFRCYDEEFETVAEYSVRGEDTDYILNFFCGVRLRDL